jgi:phosphate starvation-inducible PhoH-like protein
VEGVAFCYLTEADIVRHELVQRIVRAYDAHRAESVGLPLPKRGS